MSDPIVAAQKLTSALGELSDRLQVVAARQDEQGQYGRRNRHLIRWLVVSLALDVILTAAISVVAVKTNEANAKANETHNQQVATCLLSNEARAKNRQLWDYILKIPPTQPQTEQQKVRVAEFRDFMNGTFAPRDCSKI